MLAPSTSQNCEDYGDKYPTRESVPSRIGIIACRGISKNSEQEAAESYNSEVAEKSCN